MSFFKISPLLGDFFLRFVLLAPEKSVVRRIAWLTVTGLLFSVAALIVVISVMTALNRNQRERTLAVEPHLTLEVAKGENINALLNLPLLHEIQGPMRAQVQVYEMQDVILRSLDGRFHGAVAKGMSLKALNELLENVQRVSRRQGLGPDFAAPLSDPEEDEVYLGTDLAHSLAVYEGDPLLILPPESLLLPPSEAPRFEKVKVRQVLVTNVPQVDGQILLYVAGKSLRSLQKSASLRRGLEIRLPEADDADDLKEKFSEQKNLTVQTWKERNSALFLALKLEKGMMGTFLGMAILVAGLSMISVLSLLISQKTQEIGLLGALGFSKMGVQKLFSQIGFLLASVGLLSGVILGTGVSLYLQNYPLNILPDIYYDSEIPANVQWPFIFLIAGVGLLLSGFGAWLSVRSLKDQSPSSLLRRTT